jgi:hypothetical protein
MADLDVVTRAETAAVLGVDKSTVRKYERVGRLPAASFQTRSGSLQPIAFYPRAAVLALKTLLEIEALNKRSEKQKQVDFEQGLNDQKVHDEHIAREEAAAEFERVETRKKREVERKELETKAAAHAIAAEYELRIAALKRQTYELERENRRERLAAEARTFNVVATAAPLLLLGLAAWVGNSGAASNADQPEPDPGGGMNFLEALTLIKSHIAQDVTEEQRLCEARCAS